VIIALNQPSHQVRALSGDGYFSEVDLEDVQLDDNGMIALTAALQRNSTLRNLNLACNSINEVSKSTVILWGHNITHRTPPETEFVSPVPLPWREGRSRLPLPPHARQPTNPSDDGDHAALSHDAVECRPAVSRSTSY